ncbi:MAG: hypothetical protein WD826_00205 [Actinomycetota bacterium]
MNIDRRSIPDPTKMANRWVAHRTFGPDRIPPVKAIQERKRTERVRISVGMIADGDPSAIRPAASAITSMLMDETPFVDELVLFRPSTDVPLGRIDARVVAPDELLREVPANPGKGDMLWRSLSVLSGDVIVWVEPDARGFDPETILRLTVPILFHPPIAFVKGYFNAPSEIDLVIDDVSYLAGGTRLTDLLVRPLMNLFFPELGGFFQPLAASYAGRADCLRKIPFMSGCSAEVAMLIDLLGSLGLDGMAQVDIETPLNGDRPLDELGPDAHAIARTILKRAAERGRVQLAPNLHAHPLLVPDGDGVDIVRLDEVERPPLELVPPYLAALRSDTLSSSRPASPRKRHATDNAHVPDDSARAPLRGEWLADVRGGRS